MKRPGTVLIVAGCLIVVWLVLARIAAVNRTRSHRLRCRINLKYLGSALRLYSDGQRTYPRHDGSDFLIALYVAGLEYDWSFRCPAEHRALVPPRLGQGRMPANTSSYAARRNARPDRYPGLFTMRGASETAVASDDDEGPGRRYNHGGSVNLLFLDGHTEWFELDEPRLGGFSRGGYLDPLAD